MKSLRSDSSARALLAETRALDVGTLAAHLLHAKLSDSVCTAFQVLSHHRLQSLPVYDAEARKWVAFLDTRDLVHHLCACFSEKELHGRHLPKIVEHNGRFLPLLERKESFTEIEGAFPRRENRDAFASATVADVVAAHTTVFSPIPENSSLLAAVENMAAYASHRVPLVDEAGELVGVVTQSDVVRFLHSHADSIQALKRTVDQFNFDGGEVFCVGKESAALQAFALLDARGVTGVAVVESLDTPARTMVGNVSAYDLKMMYHNADELIMLYLPLWQFLQKAHGDAESPRAPVTCKGSTSLLQVAESIVSNRVHRVYRLDDVGHLVGVVSLGDLVNAILRSI